jgi:DNA excision repair protein ERCC-2
LAHRHQLCPFEFSLELALWADWILCDYNYVFDPRTRLRRFFSAGPNRYTLLVDEVHNLVERAREMFSAEIQKQPLLHLRRSIKTRLPRLYDRLTAINTYLLDMRRHCETAGNHSSPTPPADLYPLLGTFLHDARLALHAAGPREQDPQLEEMAWQVHGFLQIAEQYGDPYATLCEKDGANLRMKLFCRDPAEALRNIYARCRTAIFFSATATPAAYYQQSLGCAPDAEALILPSAFPAEHLRVLVAQGVSTLYRHRVRTRTTVAAMIHAMVASQPGNYLVFLPSYAYLKMIAEAFMAGADGMDVIRQYPQMSSAQRDAFLMRFNQRHPHTLVGFAVAGGIFGEGIDLIGERLTGAAVVGIGLPGMSFERELIRDYYDQSTGSGHAFAYLYPGMTRVLQAAGRVIRSEDDRGVVLLIDSRYGHEGIQQLLPSEWHLHSVRDRADIRQRLQDFW